MSTKLYDAITLMADRIIEQKDYLTELDRVIGDGDHGLNMARGFEAVKEQLLPDETDIGAALKKVAMTLLSKVGGASGPLYGTAFMRAGSVLNGKTELSPNELSDAMTAAVDGIKARGKSNQGDKTMLDALIPALNELNDKKAVTDDMTLLLNAMCEAAGKGAEYTKTIKALKGRASYLGDRSIGHIDPGAASAVVILEALKEHYETSV